MVDIHMISQGLTWISDALTQEHCIWLVILTSKGLFGNREKWAKSPAKFDSVQKCLDLGSPP